MSFPGAGDEPWREATTLEIKPGVTNGFAADERPDYEDLYFIEIVWSNGVPTRHLFSDRQIGEKWSTWKARFTEKTGVRPSWVSLGDITFFSQNVRSIELIETITHEEG